MLQLAPGWSEFIRSVAMPQQCSLPGVGHGQGFPAMHCTSRILPGKAATMAVAPSTATCRHAPTRGTRGSGYPPQPSLAESQHLNAVGPGHCFDTVAPSQSLVQRQLPSAPLEQLGFLQQMMFAAGSLGHPPLA